MNKLIVLGFMLLFSTTGFCQFPTTSLNHEIPKSRKGQFYVYWGWNRAAYALSDIHFYGENYDFELKDVVAKDRQSPFEGKLYLNPGSATIPQYNFRFGYFINEKYNLSFGIDHMKYVVQQNQSVKISGTIDRTGTKYDGAYSDEPIVIADDFLKFEHTDGLNYINLEIRRLDALLVWNHINLNLTEGVGAGVLFPRTNTTLFGGDRYDKFHVSGFGLSAMVGINIEFFNHFFIQSEVKGGYINMPNIRTTPSALSGASQQFFFGQVNLVFGANFRFGKYRLNQIPQE